MTPSSPAPPASPRWFHPTPEWLLVKLLLVEVGLLLSERFQWFAFNEHKNRALPATLVAVAAVAVVLLLWFLAAMLLRRRFQFSLRSLLVLAVVVAMPCSWIAVRMQQAKRQMEAVEALTRIRAGSVIYNETADSVPTWLSDALGIDFFQDVTSVSLHEGSNDEVFAHVECLKNLTYAMLWGSQITDAGLVHLRDLTNLKTLALAGPQFTDAGLVHLRGLKNLEALCLEGTQVTDAGLVHLRDLSNLEILFLEGEQVTDAGLEHLKELPKLEELILPDTKITDVGLESLAGFPALRCVVVGSPHTTAEGAERLRQALPSCRVQCSEPY